MLWCAVLLFVLLANVQCHFFFLCLVFDVSLSFEPIAGSAGQYKIVLVALSARPLTLSLDSEGRAHAALTINNAPAYLHRIFVFSVERTLLPPRVDYVELFGVHTGTGEAVYEKIKV